MALVVLSMSSASAANVYCCNCSDCNAKIMNAIVGDVVVLTEDIINFDGTCINFNGSDGIVFDGGGHMIDGIDSYSYHGIYLTSHSDNNVIKNCTITDFGKGIYMFTASYNTIENVTSSSNRDTGITILYSRGSVIEDCVLQENRGEDFYFRPYLGVDCSTSLVNVTGSGGRPVAFYNETVDISDEDFSSICLCYASMSTFDNVTVAGSDTIKNNAMRVYYSFGTTFTNITSSDNFMGIYATDCNDCVIRDSEFNNNHHYDVQISEGSGNVIENVKANSSSQTGIYLYHAPNNFINGVVLDSNMHGMYIDNSPNTIINNSYFTNNIMRGVMILSCGGNTFYNNYFDNTDNIYFGGTTYANDWNVTATPGTNIIGGPSIGGNYWKCYSYEDGNADGFGMSPYVVEWVINNTDYLPLVEVSGGEEMYIRNWDVTLYNGDVWEYLVTCRNVNGYDVDCGELIWSSSNTTVGTMDGANITCHAAGVTNVTVVGFNDTDTITATVQFLGCGDVDRDGRITINDVVETYLRVIDPYYEIGSEWAADVDSDDRITINDVVEIYLKVIDPSHPLNCV